MSSKQCKKPKKITVLLVICAAMFLISGLITEPLIDMIINEKLKQMMPLIPGTKTYSYWISPPLPIHFQFYFFHVLNPEEILKGGKPAVKEIGPYTYRLIDTKENLTYHKNYTVTYGERQVYVFQRQWSAGEENDTFTTLNIPLLTIASLVSTEYRFFQDLVKLLIDQAGDENLFKQLTVKDLIWGYQDPMMAKAKKIFNEFNLPFDDHFGFFHGLNNTVANNFTVYTGEDDLQKLSVYTEWNGVKKLPYWTTSQCNMINGTDGNLFHPHLKESQKLYLFFPEICRSYGISYQQRGEFEGVKYSRFVLLDEEFDNATINPNNQGFCTPSYNCLPSGLMNATSCRKGSPVVISQPHFLGADQKVIDSIVGNNPSRDLHQSYIDLVLITGTLVRTQRTTQINFFVHQTPVISQSRHLGDLYFPVMYIKELASLTDDLAAEFRDQLQLSITIATYGEYIGICIGSLLLVILCFIQCKKFRKTSKIYVSTNNTEETAKLIS